MTFHDGLPRWVRRRAERHRARHGDGRVVRWMAFGTDRRRVRLDGTPVEMGGNVLPFIRRAPSSGTEESPALDATGS